jgi:hypothetical protein
MRHAQVSTTMNVYGSAYMEGKQEAHSKVVRMMLPRANEKGRRSNGSLVTPIPWGCLGSESCKWLLGLQCLEFARGSV